MWESGGRALRIWYGWEMFQQSLVAFLLSQSARARLMAQGTRNVGNWIGPNGPFL